MVRRQLRPPRPKVGHFHQGFQCCAAASRKHKLIDPLTFERVETRRRDEVRMPDGVAQPERTGTTLVNSMERAIRWKRMLETGEFVTIAELD